VRKRGLRGKCGGRDKEELILRYFCDGARRGRRTYGTKDSTQRGMERTELLFGTDGYARFGGRGLRGLGMPSGRVPDQVRDRAVLGKQERRDQEKPAGEPA